MKVVGVPDRILGENVAAIIKVKNKDYDILKPLKIYLNNHLTRFKIPPCLPEVPEWLFPAPP